jgi:hypothetical protein
MPLDENGPARDAVATKAGEADGLRGQAAACRRLSIQARTRAGTKALNDLGDHFDEQARKLDPSSMKR